MDETNNEEATQVEKPNLQAVEGLHDVQVEKLADQIKAGDDSLNKLKVQNLDFILDIPLKVTVELGRTEVIIKDLLQLGQGSVLELDKLAGEPLEILVNGKLVAKGEVVVVNEKFGIRLTDIISPIERIETLK
jgi:flagellar motor switch protein FliN